MADPDLIGCSVLKSGYQTFSQSTQFNVSIGSEWSITVSEAVETYITQRGVRKPTTIEATAQRACSYLVDACGAQDLAQYN